MGIIGITFNKGRMTKLLQLTKASMYNNYNHGMCSRANVKQWCCTINMITNITGTEHY